MYQSTSSGKAASNEDVPASTCPRRRLSVILLNVLNENRKAHPRLWVPFADVTGKHFGDPLYFKLMEPPHRFDLVCVFHS